VEDGKKNPKWKLFVFSISFAS